MQFDSGSDFPGLYSGDGRKNESDYSDDNHDKLSKKDLLIGKRKDKKDKGYATLEGESSLEEEFETKSPLKSRRSNPFKFPSRKEKREKSHDKETKDKETDKEKKKDHEKDKDKKKDKDKIKHKSKEKKKLKQPPEFDISEELPIFGVPLSVAVERNPCHDNVKIPLVVRNCIDYIEKHGLFAEGVYKVTGVKSKVQHIYSLYNKRIPVGPNDFDLTIATSLLKQFIRFLPDPILTRDLCGKFENVTLTKDTKGLKTLISQLPACNRDLLGWLFTHFKNVTNHEKQNKMNASLLGAIFCPSLQISPRLFNAFTAYAEEIFPDVNLEQYVPPLRCISPNMPTNIDDLNTELKKQESLLGLIHFEMNSGYVCKEKEDELWAVQRNITQIKRKVKSLEREIRRSSTDVQERPTDANSDKEESEPSTNKDEESRINLNEQTKEDVQTVDRTPSVNESVDRLNVFESSPEQVNHIESSDDEEMMLRHERVELYLLAKSLRESIKSDKQKIEALTNELLEAQVTPCTIDSLSLDSVDLNDENKEQIREYNTLQVQKKNLLRSIIEEKEAIIDLKVQIRLAEAKKQFEISRKFFNF